MFKFLKSLLGGPDENELIAAIEKGALLVDVRSEKEFAQGSVKGAVNIPLQKISADSARLKGSESIIVFCQSGARSSMALKVLKKQGFQNVLNGGSWQNVLNLASRSH